MENGELKIENGEWKNENGGKSRSVSPNVRFACARLKISNFQFSIFNSFFIAESDMIY